MDSLFEKIEALQKKPAHVRRRVLYISTGLLSALVFVFWLSILPATLSKIENKGLQTASSVSPFASLMGTITEGGKNLSTIGEVLGGGMEYIREQASSSQNGVMATSTDEEIPTNEEATSSPNEAGG